jgi:hypothetical protein
MISLGFIAYGHECSHVNKSDLNPDHGWTLVEGGGRKGKNP